MFRIGDFSKLSRVSVKMRRHYDELGLLKPARVDPHTDYRYYSADQLPRLNRIIALKDLGFTLEQIAHVLDEKLSEEQIRGMLTLKRAEIEQQVLEEQARLARIEARLRQIEQEGKSPSRDVVLRKIESQLVAAIRRVLPITEDVTAMFDQLETYVASHKARAARPPLMIYHDSEFHEEGVDVEVAVPLTAPIAASDDVRVYELIGCDSMACIVHTGNYDTLGQASDQLFAWIEAHGYQIAGATREVFLRFGADSLDFELPEAYLTREAAHFVTELQVPVGRSHL